LPPHVAVLPVRRACPGNSTAWTSRLLGRSLSSRAGRIRAFCQWDGKLESGRHAAATQPASNSTVPDAISVYICSFSLSLSKITPRLSTDNSALEHSTLSPFIFTSAKDVMFSPALVSSFVCLQDYAETTQPIFHKIRWKGGTWATEESVITLRSLSLFLSPRFNGHFPGVPGLAGVYRSKG